MQREKLKIVMSHAMWSLNHLVKIINLFKTGNTNKIILRCCKAKIYFDDNFANDPLVDEMMKSVEHVVQESLMKSPSIRHSLKNVKEIAQKATFTLTLQKTKQNK